MQENLSLQSSLCSQLLSLLQHCDQKKLNQRDKNYKVCGEVWAKLKPRNGDFNHKLMKPNQGLVGKGWEAGTREFEKEPGNWWEDREPAAVEEKMNMDSGQGEVKETMSDWDKKQRQETTGREWEEMKRNKGGFELTFGSLFIGTKSNMQELKHRLARRVWNVCLSNMENCFFG